MGVPKFFRYISERYPCLSELVRTSQVPEFDNLYLDMNGIIHNCSHPNDNDVHFRITEEQIFRDIFHYLDMLFTMIKPQRLFYLAVDGVAPRAKMNQQRGRRFRSAKEAEVLEAEAKKKGEVLPSEARFDSNCITPGTPFMVRLNDALRYFIQHKISTCPSWRDCKVILSGHETPGEGEHKIMEYIRFLKAQKGYDPNTRHCLYGLDADLIMLGLCTHERHFSLLREEVKFGQKSNKPTPIHETRFFLLHLSLMREYLEQEFIAVKDKLSFPFDIEHIIDDWVLMGFLVGNDFIPNIPNLHINSNALPILYDAYIRTLPTLDGYINEGGYLNLERLQSYIGALARFDKDQFDSCFDDLKFLEGKHNDAFNTRNGDTFGGGDSDLMDMVKATEFEFDNPYGEDEETAMPLTCQDLNDEEIYEKEFEQHRRNYYVSKMKYDDMTPAVLAEQAECYIRALQWTLSYYYHGVQSWSWYYPHHYAPFISDIADFKDLKIDFDMSCPFLPFQQLMSVLPAGSRDHVPEAYKKLMLSAESEVIDYYPTNFETDLNGKKQEWEAVVLIPFIDEKRLLSAIKKVDPELTVDERARNVHGPMYEYQFNSVTQGQLQAPCTFPSIGNLLCTENKLFRESIQIEKEKLVLGPSQGALLDYYFPGFPTMKHLSYTSDFRKANVRVFDKPSRSENMIIVVQPGTDIEKETKDLANELLGTSVFVSWPHLMEAKVMKISDEKHTYMLNNSVQDTEARKFSNDVQTVKDHHISRMGIDVGQLKTIVYVQPCIGHEYVFTNKMYKLVKTWSKQESCYPLQCIVKNIKSYAKKFKKTLQVADAYKAGTEVFMLSNPYYGSFGEVIDTTNFEKNGRIKVLLTVPAEPDLMQAMDMHGRIQGSYMNAYQTAGMIGINNNVLSRITGTVLMIAGMKRQVSDGTSKINIGLQLKFPKQNEELVGYTKKENSWFYSEKVVDLVQEYYRRFPKLFFLLERHSGANDIYYESDLFDTTTGEENLKSLLSWLNSLPHQKAERRTGGSQTIDKEVTEEVINQVAKLKNQPIKSITLQIKPHLLYLADLQKSSKAPDVKANFELFDRVVVAKACDKFPIGSKGTVIGISNIKDLNPLRQDCVNKIDVFCEILFDLECSEGSSLHGIARNRIGKASVNDLINVTCGQDAPPVSSNVTQQPTTQPQTQRFDAKTKQPNGSGMSDDKKIMPKSEKPKPVQPEGPKMSYADSMHQQQPPQQQQQQPQQQPQQQNQQQQQHPRRKIEVQSKPQPQPNVAGPKKPDDFNQMWNTLKTSGNTKPPQQASSKPMPTADMNANALKNILGIRVEAPVMQKPGSLNDILGVNKSMQSMNMKEEQYNAVPAKMMPPDFLPAPPADWMNPKPLQDDIVTRMSGPSRPPGQQQFQNMPPGFVHSMPGMPGYSEPFPAQKPHVYANRGGGPAPEQVPPRQYFQNGNGSNNNGNFNGNGAPNNQPNNQSQERKNNATFFSNNNGNNNFQQKSFYQQNRYNNGSRPIQQPQHREGGSSNAFIPLQAARKIVQPSNQNAKPVMHHQKHDITAVTAQKVNTPIVNNSPKRHQESAPANPWNTGSNGKQSSRKSRLAAKFPGADN